MENNFAGLDAELLAFSNKILLRDYLENFKRSESVIYISGSFTVNQVRKLQPEDLFIDGTVLSAHLTDFPKASIELILPGAMLASDTSINSGQPLELTKPFFAALIHVAKPSKELMRFTVVPIVYGQHQIGTTKVSLSPPPILNIEGKWPLTSDTAP
jgi:hypothetical protein